jgi:dephospho-CoA kinase
MQKSERNMTIENIYIGITGLSGTGKDTVADILANLARVHSMYVYRYNLSDEVREELARRGRVADSASRAALIEVANELRATYGGGALASRIVIKDQKVHQTEDNRPNLVIVIGIRNPEEVEMFRNAWGAQFMLVTVEASQQARATRRASRGQYREDVNLSGEVEQADQAIGIPTCGQMSDWHIRNEGTLEELGAAVQTFFECNIAPVLGPGDAQS